jgi:hypothetical protein
MKSHFLCVIIFIFAIFATSFLPRLRFLRLFFVSRHQMQHLFKRKRDDLHSSCLEYVKWRKTSENLNGSRNQFYSEFCSFPSYHIPNRFQVSRTAFFNATKDIDTTLTEGDVIDLEIHKSRGRPNTLTDEEEEMVIAACREFETQYTIITRSVLVNEALHVALKKREGIEQTNEDVWCEQACMRYQRVGGWKWMSGFLKRHPEVVVSNKNDQ